MWVKLGSLHNQMSGITIPVPMLSFWRVEPSHDIGIQLDTQATWLQHFLQVITEADSYCHWYGQAGCGPCITRTIQKKSQLPFYTDIFI